MLRCKIKIKVFLYLKGFIMLQFWKPEEVVCRKLCWSSSVGHILTSLIAPSLPSLPFNVLKSLFDSMPLTTDDGVMLRRMTLEIGAIHLILACLSVLGHHAPRQQIPGFYQDVSTSLLLLFFAILCFLKVISYDDLNVYSSILWGFCISRRCC